MVAVTGGGTGGHIFPNVSVIGELKKRGIKDIIWLGEKGGKERRWAERADVPFYGIRSGKLRRYLSIKNLFVIFLIVTGFFQSLFLFLRLRPSILFSKGGFVSFPPVLAAWILKIPIVTHESDIIPGLATRIISRFASVICTSFDVTKNFFPGKKVVFTGNPVRSIVKQGKRKKGLKFLEVDESLPLVLVVGGSLGASSINRAVWELCDGEGFSFNLLHQCGEGNYRREINKKRYWQYEFFEEEIGDVLSASDLIISRAGAGALYEIGFFGKPSILIPLPKTKSRGEQIENARYFKEKGASVVLEDKDINGRVLFDTINRLLSNRSSLIKMGEAARSLCKLEGEISITDIIISFINR